MNADVTTKVIAEELGLTRHYVTATLVRRHDFPKPVLVLSQKTRRWDRDAFDSWKRRQRKAVA